VESGSEVRYALDLAANSLLRFRLNMPETSLQRLRHAKSRVVAEIIWSSDGEQLILFGRLIGPDEIDLTRTWREDMTNGPEHAGHGELIFRVHSWPESDLKAFVFWGMPRIFDQSSFKRRASDAAPEPRTMDETPLTSERVAELEAELQRARAAEAAVTTELDQKVKRVAELQMRILELEKKLEARAAEPQVEAGIGDRLKGMFRK
jgi:hypothetical protein